MMIYALGYKRICKYTIIGMIIASIIYGLVKCFVHEFLIPAKSTSN